MGGTPGLGTASFGNFVCLYYFLLNYVVVVVHGCDPAEGGLCVYLGFSCKVHRKLENSSIMLVNKSCCSKLCICISVSYMQ